MAKEKIGIYLGSHSVSAVRVENKQVVASAKYDLASLEEETKLENLNDDIRWEALINKTLREIGAESKEVYLSLNDKDLIFRSFELPYMKRSEIKSSLMYEIERYIPFKIEELCWDHEYVRFPREKKINLSFLGIQQNAYQKIQDIFQHLGLTLLASEPAALSLVRALKSDKKYGSLKNFALLDFTEKESYLTFFYHNLPVFNRFLNVPKEGQAINYERFIESVRFSFQYFTREFKTYQMDKLLILTNSIDDHLKEMATLLSEELQIAVEPISAQGFLGDQVNSVEVMKAAGVVGRTYLPYPFKPALLTTEQQMEETQLAIEEPFKVGLLASVVIVCAVVILLILGVKAHTFSERNAEFRQQQQALAIPKVLQNMNWQQRQEFVSKEKQRLNAIEDVQKDFKKTSAFLVLLAAAVPEGMWFEEFDVLRSARGQYQGTLRGYVYLKDGYQERRMIDDFIQELQTSASRQELFKSVELVSVSQEEKRRFEVTSFRIRFD